MSRARDVARRAVPYGLPTVGLQGELYGLVRADREVSGSGMLGRLQPLYAGSVLGVAAGRPGNAGTHAYACLDLRTGPVVVFTPARLSVWLIDLYAGVVGRVPGTAALEGRSCLVHGPSSTSPDLVVDDEFASATDLCLLVVGSEAESVDDALPGSLAAAVTVQPLGTPAAELDPPDPVDLLEPLGTSFLRTLDWMLHLMPRLPKDYPLRAELAELGCGSGQVDVVLADAGFRSEVLEGLRLGLADVAGWVPTMGGVESVSNGRHRPVDLVRAAVTHRETVDLSSERFAHSLEET